MAVLPQRAVHLGSKPLQRQGHQNSPWNIQDQGIVWLQYDYSQWTLETSRNSPSAPGGHFPTHLPATAAAPASSGSCFEIRASPPHGPCGSKCRDSRGPRPPPIATCMISDGENMGKWWWAHFKVPYDPISGHTSRCTTGSWRTPCQAPSSRPSRSPRPCKRANGSPSTSIYGSKWDVSYLSNIHYRGFIWFWPKNNYKKTYKVIQIIHKISSKISKKAMPWGSHWAAALFPRLARSPLIPRACSWRSAVS